MTITLLTTVSFCTTVLPQLVTREVESSPRFCVQRENNSQWSLEVPTSANPILSVSTLLKATLQLEFVVSPLQYIIPANKFFTTFSVGQMESNAPGQTHSVGFLLSQTAFWFGRSSQRRYASLFFNCNSLSPDHNISHHSLFLRKNYGSWIGSNCRLPHYLYCLYVGCWKHLSYGSLKVSIFLCCVGN